MSASGEPHLPFRWDLIAPDHLGALLDGAETPDLWFIEDLIACGGKVVARSGNGDLYFVGRSLDSLFDLLGGALAQTEWRNRLHRLPLSFQRSSKRVGGRWGDRPLTGTETARARQILGDLGLDPRSLARRDRLAVFVDVVDGGSTFTNLFELLHRWIEHEREAWSVIRRKLRFVGVTYRTKTSPNTYRWHQHADWTRQLPARSVVNISLHGHVWSYLGNSQTKLTRTFRPEDWLATSEGPQRGDQTRQALAEALAIVQYGRTSEARASLARATAGEPALSEPWLRSLIVQLNRG